MVRRRPESVNLACHRLYPPCAMRYSSPRASASENCHFRETGLHKHSMYPAWRLNIRRWAVGSISRESRQSYGTLWAIRAGGYIYRCGDLFLAKSCTRVERGGSTCGQPGREGCDQEEKHTNGGESSWVGRLDFDQHAFHDARQPDSREHPESDAHGAQPKRG